MDNSFSVKNSDTVFVNVMAIGRQVMTVTLSGNASLEELMDEVKSRLAGLDGLLTVNLRNSSQGTATKRVLRLRKPSSGLLRAQMKGYAA